MKLRSQAIMCGINRPRALPLNEAKHRIIRSIEKLQDWLEKHDYEGYEPFDGLLSYLRPLAFRNPFAERVLEQAVLRCPFNMRPLLGIRPRKPAQGIGFLARGYLRMWVMTKDIKYKNKATYCLDWLIQNYSHGYSGFCWGHNFAYASRGGQGHKHLPTVVWTSLIGQAFLDAYEILGDREYLEVAQSICDFIIKDLFHTEKETGICISYHPIVDASAIHNANMLGAAMLARTCRYQHDSNALKVAKEAMEYSCTRQLSSGGWYYGEAPMYHWIDSWHTAYNLDSLKCYVENTNDERFEKNLLRGLGFYKDNFFQENGKPKYYFDRLYLVDIQCASQAVDTLSYCADYDDSCLKLASQVASWTIRHMQDKSGYFYYRKLRWKKVKVPMLHWGQATMFCALTHLLSKADRAQRNLP